MCECQFNSIIDAWVKKMTDKIPIYNMTNNFFIYQAKNEN